MPIIDDIKDRVKMADLLNAYGIAPKRGTNIYCCVFHHDKHPSANIIKGSDRFQCFVCGRTWDIFDFVQEYEHCDLSTAIKQIDRKMGLNLTRTMTNAERKELERAEEERKRERSERLKRKAWELNVRNRITARLQFYDDVEYRLRPYWHEVATAEWKVGNLYSHVLKEQERLETLYDLLYGTDYPDNTYFYLYGTDKTKIYERIAKGEIKI